MEIKVTMLDVKDGDAIILELTKSDKTLIMVIDGGNSSCYEAKVRPKLVEILTNHNKNAPDIVVCTHYDSDHIGGLIPLIEEYIGNIKEVWIHITPETMKGYIEEAIHIINQKSRPTGDFKMYSYQNLFENEIIEKKQILKKRSDFILESLPQLKKLIDLIPNNKLRQVYYKDKPLPDWQERIVLGPTKDYYESLFPSKKRFETFIKEEAKEAILTEKTLTIQTLECFDIVPCDYLKEDNQTALTATNKACIIIAIDNDKGRYLFTGDAGIESFKKIPNWQNELKDLYFLKIPHHGIDNNISKEIIELMQPVYAYNSGYNHQDEAVLKCIEAKKRNSCVMSTKTNGDLVFPQTSRLFEQTDFSNGFRLR